MKNININKIESRASKTEFDTIKKILEAIKPGGSENPFKARDAQIRNAVVFLMLIEYGIRTSDLIELKVDDFDEQEGTLSIGASEPRRNKFNMGPLKQSRHRILRISTHLKSLIFEYIATIRSKIPNANRHSYLFVNTTGPRAGERMTTSGLHHMFNKVRSFNKEFKSISLSSIRQVYIQRVYELENKRAEFTANSSQISNEIIVGVQNSELLLVSTEEKKNE